MAEICVSDHRLSHDHVSRAACHGLGIIWFTMSLRHAQKHPFITWKVMKPQVSGMGSASDYHCIIPAALSLFPQPTRLTSWKFLWSVGRLCLHTSDPFCLVLCPRILTHMDTASLCLPCQLASSWFQSIGHQYVGGWMDRVGRTFVPCFLPAWVLHLWP